PEPGPVVPGGMDFIDETLPTLGDNALVVWNGQASTTPFMASISTRMPREVVVDLLDRPADGPAPVWGAGALTITDTVTLLYPNGPNTPDASRGFTVSFGAGARTPLERFVVQRSGEGRVIDVDAYLVGGGDWTARGGRPPAELNRAMADAGAVLRAAGVELGELRVHEVFGALRDDFAVLEGASGPVGVPDELDDMYRLTAGQNRPGLAIFFVRSIEGALGIASGIPGPHVLPGNGASGVAISVDLIPLDEIGLVIAHEVGHYMGLFHTSEIDGQVNDPFPDTEECRIARDRDGDGFLLPSECRGAGADLLMFWAAQAGRISPQQSTVMRRAYFVR
ncbi:MAG TPA: hypothetical protein DEF51_38825, partial [Myxococcales bacterium]|nr:hypothetical protein [Myxococcales bacterium]